MDKKGIFLSKTLVIGVFVLFVGAVVVPCISSDLLITNNLEILFEDDFNDNIKDLDKWSEYYNLGEWSEQNQRTELNLNSTNGYYLLEGIDSINISVVITEDDPVIISADMISFIAGNTNYGQVRIEVTDGVNFIRLYYYRIENRLMYRVSNVDDYITLGYRGDGSWSNEIVIFSNRYQVQMGTYKSGWVYDSLFSTTNEIKIILFIKLDQPPGDIFRAGFDNAMVQFYENDPPTPPIIDGPPEGRVGEESEFTFYATDPDGNDVYYYIDWGDGNIEEWLGPYDSGLEIAIGHIWEAQGTYLIKAKAKDIFDAESDWALSIVTMVEHQPPTTPTIDGPESGKAGVSYTYSALSTDPNGDQLYYWFDWNDTTNTGWIGLYPSGTQASLSHIWDADGDYHIKVKAKDIYDFESPWGEFDISILRSRVSTYSFFYELFERFPILQKVLFYFVK